MGWLAIVTAMLLVGTSLTHAIINGTLDGNLHPNVGVVVAEANGERFTPCSGNLIAPKVFVTAAHCLEFIASRGATQVWVTFDSRADVHRSPLLPGTPHPNPAFDPDAPDPNDVAVITFDTPVKWIEPVDLPTPGLLDKVDADQLFTVVGYGAHYDRTVDGGPPVLVRDGARRFATSKFEALDPALLRLSIDASRGYGGASFGDSGGAIFQGHSTTMVAIVGLRGDEAVYEGYRLDSASARAFLSGFVKLPRKGDPERKGGHRRRCHK